MQDIREILGIKIESPLWDMAYQIAQKEIGVPEWLTKEYIINLHEKYDLLRYNYECIADAAQYVADNPELCMLAKTIYYILGERKGRAASFVSLEFPKAPEGTENTKGYDFVGIFPVIAHLLPSWREIEKRGVDKDVISDSLTTLDKLFTWSSERLGKKCFGEAEFLLYGAAIYINYLVMGRLRFEICPGAQVKFRAFENSKKEICILMDNVIMHKSGHILSSFGYEDEEGSFESDFAETDEFFEGYTVDENTRLVKRERLRLSKNEWKQIFASGNDAIMIHIPFGGKLDKNECEKSYKRAKEIFTRCYPEMNFKGFIITCWMLSPIFKEILSEESNIVSFQKKYITFPCKTSATDAYMYVFGFKGESLKELDFANLPESNSIMRGLKQKGLKGEFAHEFSGFSTF